jgi:serine/threonine protein kinase
MDAVMASQRLGRFELKRVLGRGAQAQVWLAFDARLEREVAVKLLDKDAGSVAVSQWLHEARAVSRLHHPHIVPVFEADEHAGQSYLVFEYVPGPTLAQLLRERGALPPHEAVTMMLGVLDALRAAHERGIVHRDLKPSNILIDADGRARVMDFGIAARVSEGQRHAPLIVGTPGYMSPEAARGEAPAPSMDLFAAGVMLAEMLSGQKLLRERDPRVALERTIHEDLSLPAGLDSAVDDTLRALARRAMARDPAARPASAAELHGALACWLQPPAAGEGAGGSSGTVEFLLRRMRHKTDFPALSDAVSRIQRVASSEHENLNSLSAEILQDVALTNKLLRLVNTAHFRHAGGGTISTVSRAVALVGFAGIRNMALSLVLLDHMHDKAHAQRLKEEFLRSLMAGSLAGELCATVRDGEEAFIAAMFQNLGRLLTEFYFPEEAQQVRRLVAPSGRHPTEVPPSEEAAAARVLGVTFEELGAGIAKSWGLPDGLQRAMRKPAGEPPATPPPHGPETLRWVAAAANEVATALLESGGDEARARVADIAARYGKAIGAGERDLHGAVEGARRRLSQTAQAMGLHLAPKSPARRLLVPLSEAPRVDDTLSPHELQATLPAPLDADAQTVALGPTPEQVAYVLAAGVQDITDHMAGENFRLNEVLRMILETMYRALAFRRVVFCLRDPKTHTLTGRFGLGEDAVRVSGAFRVPLRIAAGAAADLFSAVCLKGADTLIADSTAANISQRLPAWFIEQVRAPAFLLLPLTMRNAPFALIYADKAQAGGIALGERELALLRTLRNQAVMAFRQA